MNTDSHRKHAPAHPNVLLISCDQMRAMAMSCAGDPNIHTPNLDRLAAQGARWDRMFTPSPLCCPARASMQTGFYPHNAGFDYDNRGSLRDDRPTFAEYFAAAGYDTAHIGKWHLCGRRSPDGRFVPLEHHRGFAHWLGYEHGHADYFRSVHFGKDATPVTPEPGTYEVDFQTDRAMAWIETKLTEPWFMDLSFGPPHFPLTPGNVKVEDLARFDPRKLSLRPNVPADRISDGDRLEMSVYHAMIASIDQNLGHLLDHLETRRVLDSTVVVFTSDHGDMLFSHDCVYKRRLHEESSRVPFLVRHPAQVPAGRVVAALGSLVDLVPTLLDLAGLVLPKVEGVSLAAHLRGVAEQPARTSVPMGCHWLGCRPRGGRHVKAHWRGLRTDRHAITFLQRDGRACPVELFDLDQDPYQMQNLVEQSDQSAVIDSLWDQLQAHFKATADERFARLTRTAAG